MNSIYLNKEFYNIDAIKTAIDDFSKIAEIDVFEKDGNNYLVFSNCKYTCEETMKEFENYLIQLEYKK